MGQAISYTLSNWKALNRYVEDGDLDMYLVDNSGPNTLYRNNGDGTFELPVPWRRSHVVVFEKRGYKATRIHFQ
mgnify:CR=1 FL=1